MSVVTWLQLPATRSTADIYELGAGRDDKQLAKAYPADKETAVENSCTHGHVDEWARMGNPRKVWQAIEPTMAGSCHIVTTGLGPTNHTSIYWRRCLAGDAPHHPCFIGALARPDRTTAWLRAKRQGMGREIEAMHRAWPDNAAGEDVRENLDLPEHQVIGFTTNASSRARIIQKLRIAIQRWLIQWDSDLHPQLDAEMRGYQLPDDNVVQDSVIALAIALEHAPHAYQGGRILGVIQV
jgi:hypothetical protein